MEKRGGRGEFSFDTHPLIRAYFGAQVQQENPAGWRQAHFVLFEHFQAVPDKPRPDTLEELEPLYRAVHHGCLAEEYRKAEFDVFQNRIRRGNEAYSWKKLGAFASDLAAIADFFPQGWTQPVTQGLSEADQGWLLAVAAFCLMSLGRLAEAVEPRRANILLYEKLEDWNNAAPSAENLVDLLLPLGELAEAQRVSQQGIAWANRTTDQFRQMVSQTKLAAALHRQGQFAESAHAFAAAEALQAEYQPEYPRLYSLPGFLYCTLLLDCARDDAAWEAVLDRGQWTITVEFGRLLDLAFDHLTIARALNALRRTTESRDEFDAAVAGMRKAGSVMDMPDVLLARARFYRQCGELDAAQEDWDEAWEMIERCGMRLYAAEAWLLRGHLEVDRIAGILPAQGQAGETPAIHAYDQANALIAEMGYGLRVAELALLAARITHYAQNLPGCENLSGLSAQEHLAAARARIEEIGQWGLWPAWEQVEQELKQPPPDLTGLQDLSGSSVRCLTC